MKITVLIENTCRRLGLGAEHGLSLLIETGGLKLLCDTGATGLFAKNAKSVGLDLRDVDAVFISHAHYDHTGGLSAFFRLNKDAPVYISSRAFNGAWARRAGGETEYIGIPESIAQSDRFVHIEGTTQIVPGITVFSEVSGRRLLSEANALLLEKKAEGFVPDRFLHEQHMAVFENGKSILLAGCCHGGIVNVIDRFIDLFGTTPDWAVGGFHLMSPSEKKPILESKVQEIAQILSTLTTRFLTGHCTGEASYAILERELGEKIRPISVGDVFEI